MNRQVTFQGNPLTLIGRVLTLNMPAPDFKVTTVELKPFSLVDLKNKIKILTSFPSIDTPVCDLQVKEFNKRATSLSHDVVIAGLSKDLPFAQKRFCDANSIKNVITLSDYATNSFGINYGLLIKELNLLARSVIILDTNNIVRSIQIVTEITEAPDYEAVVKDLESVIKKPSISQSTQATHCTACKTGVLPYSKDKLAAELKGLKHWQLVDENKIAKDFSFKNFDEAKLFVDVIAHIASEQGHHPTVLLTYNKVTITLTTHAAKGLTENDFIMARIIDQL